MYFENFQLRSYDYNFVKEFIETRKKDSQVIMLPQRGEWITILFEDSAIGEKIIMELTNELQTKAFFLESDGDKSWSFILYSDGKVVDEYYNDPIAGFEPEDYDREQLKEIYEAILTPHSTFADFLEFLQGKNKLSKKTMEKFASFFGLKDVEVSYEQFYDRVEELQGAIIF
ncbi:hypothetical protein [Carboxydothermus hydrogenoformans]|uniref:Uncharacterized protein n=1 Tax=Carboxydothermus hydrogenoformans (strain ATCC BAA-161 / DSM 6008 / Z-2901) TaxID=246194 RepID=Q3AEV4_CARHZ|nr:hypothetical protein [Carboxydothermus hydrogenoformans]ABB14102.1 hypothetical protein CHY_0472 [Carboxydothermus hydrogenoformans Z-2901]